ncbi:MAG: hypothetical protein AAF458_18440 [Pseudomonadota bacterium]
MTGPEDDAYDLHPRFPVVEGCVEAIDGWRVTLGAPHNRRISGGSVVLWRSGLTFWLTVVRSSRPGVSAADRMTAFRRAVPEAAYGLVIARRPLSTVACYRLNEVHDDDVGLLGTYGVAIGATDSIEVAAYFDEEDGYRAARDLIWSLEPVARAP